MPKKPPAETALYVRLPAQVGAKLTRAAEELGVHKKVLVANLVSKYIEPEVQHTRAMATTTASNSGPTLGAYSFQPYAAPEVLEVMNVAQAAQLLQIDEGVVFELAEAGQLPGRKLGAHWRFARAALMDWLANPERR